MQAVLEIDMKRNTNPAGRQPAAVRVSGAVQQKQGAAQ